MFHLTVRDHIMIAHSLAHPSFGPAQQLHGATYVVELTMWRAVLGPDAVVIDIGVATALLSEVLDDLNYRNLDEHPDLAGVLTTTEALAQIIAERLSSRLAHHGLARLDVTLRESPDAWAGFTMTFPPTAAP